MQSGYALCTQDNSKVLCLTKTDSKVELVEVSDVSNLNKALCLPDLTSIKSVYERFKEQDLVGDLDIVNIAKLYKNRW
tara:strand:- start:583 stop:816 length:234 start_codon:yes stop_codon:yes gene_type:complete